MLQGLVGCRPGNRQGTSISPDRWTDLQTPDHVQGSSSPRTPVRLLLELQARSRARSD